MKVVLGLLVALLALTGCNGYAEYFKEAGYGLNNENIQCRAEPACKRCPSPRPRQERLLL
jgi:hypothetical protein